MVGEVLSEHNEVAPYYAGLPALFEFSFWYRLEWAINNGTGRYLANDLLGYRQEYAAVRPDYIAATKLTNHDEDRAASLLGRNADKCRLAAAVLLTAQGTPYIYYGEELGLFGTKGNGDEYVRGPMLWDDNYTTSYTDKIDPQVEAEVPSVSAQQNDNASLLATYLDFIRLRNTYPALATGTMSKHGVQRDERCLSLIGRLVHDARRPADVGVAQLRRHGHRTAPDRRCAESRGHARHGGASHARRTDNDSLGRICFGGLSAGIKAVVSD